MPYDRHLTRQQIDLVARDESAIKFDIQSHLDVCPDCHADIQVRRLEWHFAAIGKESPPAGPGESCPPTIHWALVACGTDNQDVRAAVAHAATCALCATKLRQALIDAASKDTPEQEEFAQSLLRTHPVKAAELIPNLEYGETRKMSRTWWWAAVAACVVAAIVWRASARPPFDLLAQAYSDQRTIEPRLPSARYAPFRAERGDTSSLARSPNLIRAEAAVMNGLAAHPEDALWLEAQARADLLEGRYREAIVELKRALEARPDLGALKVDLATAYYESGEGGHAIDYRESLRLLSEELARDPSNNLVRYNLILVYQRLHLYDSAVADCEAYLRSEPKGEWAEDVRRRMAEIVDLRNRHAADVNGIIQDSHRFAQTVEKRGTDLDEIRRHYEDYIEVALLHWMKDSAPTPQGSIRAIAALAAIGESDHGDKWLLDLTANGFPQDSESISALISAVAANLSGSHLEAIEAADHARLLFHQASNPAGELRAALERMYAAHRLAHAQECAATGEETYPAARLHAYRWIQVQILIERSICWSMLGDLQKGSHFVNDAIQEAQAAHLDDLHLRALGIRASIETARGDVGRAWAEDKVGLDEYWAGHFRPLRAYQFYSDLSYAGGVREVRVLEAMAREAVDNIAHSPNRSVEALARQHLASLATSSGDVSEALAQWNEATQLFSSLPQTEQTRLYELSGEVEKASLESQQNPGLLSLAHLGALEAGVLRSGDFFLPVRFYRAKSEAHRLRGQNDAAQKDLQLALRYAEQGLAPNAHKSSNAWTDKTEETYRTLVAFKFRMQGDPTQALQLWENYRASAFAGGASAALQDPLNGLAQMTSETLLTYAQFGDGLAIWMRDKRGVETHFLPIPENRMAELANRFVEECASPSSSRASIFRDGRALYNLLIAPVRAHLLSDRILIIEPDAALASVPFEALVEPDGEYLGAHYAMRSIEGSYEPSAPSSHLQINRSERALIVSDPALSGSAAEAFPRLSDAEREGTAVSRQFADAQLLSGLRATIQALTAELPLSAVFHFAGHAFSNQNGGGLLLALSDKKSSDSSGAEVLSSSRLNRRMLRRCALAVLSACSTAAGDSIDPARSTGLARAFLANGVPIVVASRWNTDSSSSATYMAAFYTALLGGASVPVSLRRAAAVVRENGSTSHPYYWAVFHSFSGA